MGDRDLVGAEWVKSYPQVHAHWDGGVCLLPVAA